MKNKYQLTALSANLNDCLILRFKWFYKKVFRMIIHLYNRDTKETLRIIYNSLAYSELIGSQYYIISSYS